MLRIVEVQVSVADIEVVFIELQVEVYNHYLFFNKSNMYIHRAKVYKCSN